MAKLVTFETPDGGTFYHLTEAQKAKEVELFGPFAALGNKAAEKGMCHVTHHMEDPDAPGSYWSIIAESGACTPVAFQQFFHWVLMQNLSKYTTEVNCMPSYFYSYLRPYFHLLHRNSTGPDDQWRELHFKLVAEIIDNIVPDLAPDLFRLVDINDDGTITAEEWAKCHTLLLKPEPRALIGLLFKLLDKDNSATVEKEEMCAFAKKVINLMFRTVQNVLPLVAKAVSTAMSSEAVDKVFAMMDEDGDGKLTPEEITRHFKGLEHALAGINFVSSAAPLLNEIREKDHEIAYLQAQIAKLEGVEPYPSYYYAEFEVSAEEFKMFLKLLPELGGNMRWGRNIQNGAPDCVTFRSMLGKLVAVASKLLVKLFLTIVDTPMLRDHDKDS